MRMSALEVQAGRGAYQVLIEPGLLQRAGTLLAPLVRAKRIAIVSDRLVWAAQGERLRASLETAGIEVAPILFEPGEGSKSWRALETLIDLLLALKIERGDPIVAFGGGVVGDLAGFAASILKRGCGLVQIPTSLLAQVDSAVGGKTAINTARGKNLVGSFYPPDLVLIDPNVLDTLPPRQLAAGYAEVVKYGLIGDAGFFAWCEANGAALLVGDAEARRHAIATCLAMKAAIVAEDERETGRRRALLNLGHTFAHALEAEAGFSDTLLHGEAVAIGLAFAFRFSAERGLCPAADADRVVAHLQSVGLPMRFDADPARLVEHMRGDKKAVAGSVPFILARGIGQAFVDRSVDLAEVASFLARIGQ
jgi:3-dehydroquinate synthase